MPVTNRHSFQGYAGQRAGAQQNDLGIYWYNSRWYDQLTGRFLQPDTIVPEPGNPQSLNRYAYVRNNPVNYSDPSGYAECAAGDMACWQSESQYKPDAQELAPGPAGSEHGMAGPASHRVTAAGASPPVRPHPRSRSASAECRSATLSLFTATAMARRVPTMTTNSFARVTAV